MAAGLLVLGNVDADRAIEQVSETRGCSVPETAEQRQWLANFAAVVAPR